MMEVNNGNRIYIENETLKVVKSIDKFINTEYYITVIYNTVIKAVQ